MVPALPETLPGATEFDLDVRLQAVARYGSDERAERPQTASCKECEEGSNSPACCTIGAGRAAI
jgi:hypothetical protein